MVTNKVLVITAVMILVGVSFGHQNGAHELKEAQMRLGGVHQVRQVQMQGLLRDLRLLVMMMIFVLRLFIPRSILVKLLVLVLIVILTVAGCNWLEMTVVSIALLWKRRRGMVFAMALVFWWMERARVGRDQNLGFHHGKVSCAGWLLMLICFFLLINPVAAVTDMIIGMWVGFCTFVMYMGLGLLILAIVLYFDFDFHGLVWSLIAVCYLPGVDAELMEVFNWQQWNYVSIQGFVNYVVLICLLIMLYMRSNVTKWYTYVLTVVFYFLFYPYVSYSLWDLLSVSSVIYLWFQPRRARMVSAVVLGIQFMMGSYMWHNIANRMLVCNLFWWLPSGRYDFQHGGINIRINRRICQWTFAWLTGIFLPMPVFISFLCCMTDTFGVISIFSVSSSILSLLGHGHGGFLSVMNVLRGRQLYSNSILEHVTTSEDLEEYLMFFDEGYESGFYRWIFYSQEPSVLHKRSKCQSCHYQCPNGRWLNVVFTDWIRTTFGILDVGTTTAHEHQEHINQRKKVVNWPRLMPFSAVLISVIRVMVLQLGLGYYPMFTAALFVLLSPWILPSVHEMWQMRWSWTYVQRVCRRVYNWFYYKIYRVRGQEILNEGIVERVEQLEIRPVERPVRRSGRLSAQARGDYERQLNLWNEYQEALRQREQLLQQHEEEDEEIVEDEELMAIEQLAFVEDQSIIEDRCLTKWPWVVWSLLYVLAITSLGFPPVVWCGFILLLLVSGVDGVDFTGEQGKPLFEEAFKWFSQNAKKIQSQPKWITKFEQILWGACDWKCRLWQLSDQMDTICLMALFLFFLVLYLRFVQRLTRKSFFCWTILLVHCIGLYMSAIGHATVAVIVCLMCVLGHFCGFGGCSVDIISFFGLHFPFVGCLMIARTLISWESLWDLWFRWDLLSFICILLLTGMFIGFLAACELRSTTFGCGKVIIERDARTGRLISRSEDFGIIGNTIFGVCFGETGGCTATCLASVLSSQITVQRDCIKRFLTPGPSDGGVSPQFVKQLMDNAARNGTMGQFLEAINTGGPIPESVLTHVKATLDPRCFGVVCVGGKPLANGTVIRTGKGSILMCNLHTVIDPLTLDDVFSKGDHSKVKIQGEITWNNGDRTYSLDVISYCAESDICLCSGVESLPGMEVGPYVVGKPLIWVGCAPPLTHPGRIFCYPVHPHPFGCIQHQASELGDSGSVCIDSQGRVCAMKYGVQTMQGRITHLSFFVQTYQLKDLDMRCPKICSSSMIDLKQAVENRDYFQFVCEFMKMSDECLKAAEDCFKNRDLPGLNKVLDEMSKQAVLGRSVGQLLQGILQHTKAKELMNRDELSSDQKYLNLLGELSEVTERIRMLTLARGEGQWDEEEQQLRETIEQLEQHCNELKKELRERYPLSDKEKSLNKELGELGMRKHQLKLQIRDAEESEHSDKIITLRAELKEVNKALGIAAKAMEDVKYMCRNLIETGPSRMPKGLGQLKYPFYYQNEDKSWTTWFSDDDSHSGTKHPIFDPDVMKHHEEFGYTLSQFKKRLQNCCVSKQWFLMMKQHEESSGLCNWVFKGWQGGCPYCIYCQNCGWNKICDKTLHSGCSKYLTECLERHLGTCGSNRDIDDTDFCINGTVLSLKDKKLVYCGQTCKQNHECVRTQDQIDMNKVRLWYQVHDHGRKWYISRRCVHELVQSVQVQLMASTPEIDSCKHQIQDLACTMEIQLKRSLECVGAINQHADSMQELIVKVNENSRRIKDLDMTNNDWQDKLNCYATKIELESALKKVTFDIQPRSTTPVKPRSRQSTPAASGCESEGELGDWSPRPQRKRKQKSKPETQPTSGDEGRQGGDQGDRAQLFISNRDGKHDELVGDCNCPRCVCQPNCGCPLCSGQACIWCNKIGHSTKECDYAKKRTCRDCGNGYGDWYKKCMYDPGKGLYGTDKVCCTTAKKCVICNCAGHHPLSCPVARHSTFSRQPGNVNRHGLDQQLLDSMLIPPFEGGVRERRPVQKGKQRRERNDQDF